jgi:hypothetical protein
LRFGKQRIHCKKIRNQKEMLSMPAEVETMFYTREVPWHGLGVRVEETLSSEEALEKSGSTGR